MRADKLFRTALWLILLCGSVAGCVSDIACPDTAGRGTLSFAFQNVSVQTETRSTPAQLGTPVAEDFTLTLVSSNNRTYYDGKFTNEEFNLPIGIYSVEAHCGNNPQIAVDAPYFCGSVEAEVKEDEHVTAELTAKVANALISVRFGADDETAARFDRFYENYSVNVYIGNIYASITCDHPEKSVYVRAGSTVELTFSGYLKALGQQVSIPIVLPEGISYTLQAADHLIITLSLEPNAESAVVTVTKAELEKVDVEEKISYNWLPSPVVTTEHQYVRGELVGTNLSIGASFPDATWEASIHQGSASGNVVRVLSGTGALTSTYDMNPSWPYLPPGTYVATYRYYSKQGKAFNFSKTTEFTVPNANLTLTADAYTSYSYYEEGEIAMANACERLTVYEPRAELNVAASLFANENYTKTYTTSIAGKTKTIPATSYSMTLDNITEVPVSANSYTLTITANFCGQEVAASKQVRITGLPYSLNLKSHGEWSASGSVDWFDNDVRLGHLSIGGQYITNNSSVFIPQGTKYCADYDVNVHSSTVGTTFSITAGTQEILSITEDGGLFNNKDNRHKGTTNTFTANNEITSIKCNNSYGAGQTCTHIYALTFKYGQ